MAQPGSTTFYFFIFGSEIKYGLIYGIDHFFVNSGRFGLRFFLKKFCFLISLKLTRKLHENPGKFGQNWVELKLENQS